MRDAIRVSFACLNPNMVLLL